MPSPRKRIARKHPVSRKKSPVRKTTPVLDLVRKGVEQFVLMDATMMSFQKMIRAASKKGDAWRHPLSGAEFRRIVKEAVQERRRRVRRALREQIEWDQENF